MRQHYEKPLPRTGRNITVFQHVFPNRSIDRFAKGGKVILFDIKRKTCRPAKSDDRIFCARRSWDERAEKGYMKKIEDDFQSLTMAVLSETIKGISLSQSITINSFFSLWYFRAKNRILPNQEVDAHGIEGSKLNKDQEEVLESNGNVFVREENRMPARFLNGMTIQVSIKHHIRKLARYDWAIVRSKEGEFLVPDAPRAGIIPLSPNYCLVTSVANGSANKEGVAQINQLLLGGVLEYYFARDLAACPI